MGLLAAAAGHPAIKRGLRYLIFLARLVTPTRGHVVVCGWPQSEGNSVELVRYLGRAAFRVRWLVDDAQAEDVRELAALLPTVQVLPRRSARGLLAYLTARVIFFTHGLYLSGPSPRRKHVVNLWHGDGPKRNVAPNDGLKVQCDYVVSGSALFGRAKAEYFGLGPDRLLLTGNPRNDALSRQVDAAVLARLGLRQRGFVIYMPTFRSARSHGHIAAWQDSVAQEDPRVEVLVNLVRAAADRGLSVVVKPHPLDGVPLDVVGARMIHDSDLSAAAMSSYELLAASHSLVTDYSSIWTDYLSTGRFVGFAVPDWDSYAGSRGLEAGFTTADLPGPVMESADDVARFIVDAEEEAPGLVILRERAVAACGLVTEPGSCRRLVEALVDRGIMPDRVEAFSQ